MKTFEEYIKERSQVDEGILDTVKNYGKVAAVGAGMLGAGIGMGRYSNSAQTPAINNQRVTSDDADTFFQGADDYHYSSEIGRYKALEDGRGGYIYQTKNGTFKKIPSKFRPTGYKFVRLK